MGRSPDTAKAIAEFVSGIKPAAIPVEVWTTAELHLLDGLATAIGGSSEESSQLLLSHFLAQRSRSEATVLGTSVKLPAEHAAMVNGVQAHVLDYDDAQLTTDGSRPMGQQTHPTSVVLSAALALGDARAVTGAELLLAYIAGVEVACRLGDAIHPHHYLAGLHPTGTLGVFGAAAACARLLKLDPAAIRRALGIAGSLSSGLRANRGTMAKAINAGHAAQSGVLAAKLAGRGFTAAENIFDMPMGFFDALCPRGVNRRLLRFGAPFFFDRPGIAIKLYPCAGVLHPGLDALLSLRARHKIAPGDVERIRVRLDHRAALPLVYDDPKDPLQAKFSLPFAFAAALVDGAAGLGQFCAARLRDPEIRSLMLRVEVISQRFGSQKRAGIDTEVEIHTGRAAHRARSSIARGHPARPATRADVEEKFRQCAAGVLPARAIEKFLDNFSALRGIRSIASWLQPLRGSRRR